MDRISRLPTFGSVYEPQKMKELVRLLELFLNGQNSVTGGGSSSGLSDAIPQPLGTASAGVGTAASRDDHVHAMPSADDVGADAQGAAATAIASHVAEANPHPQYLQAGDITEFPFSTDRVDADTTLTVPEEYNLLLTNRGLDVRGTLDVRGQVFSVSPSVPESPAGYVYTFVSADQVWTIPESTQALFTEAIEVDGSIEIEGVLAEVS